MSLLNHQKNPLLLNSTSLVKNSLLNLGSIRNKKFYIIFGGKCLGIHLHVPSRHPQQLIWHLLKFKLDQKEVSLISNILSKGSPELGDDRFKSSRVLRRKSAFFHRVKFEELKFGISSWKFGGSIRRPNSQITFDVVV